MRRLPKQRFLRGLLKSNMITEKDIPLIERKMADFKRYQQLNVAFTNARGHRWAGRLQAFANWLWENREIILQILGLVIMFADDGTPTVRDESELDEETLKSAKQNLAKRKPTKFTPSGEKVEDFTSEPEKTDSEKALDTLTAEAQEQGFYDIGLNPTELHETKEADDAEGQGLRREEETRQETEGEVSGDEDDEVQSGETSGEATDRLKSDDV